MKFCTNCGKQIEDSSLWCRFCGAAQPPEQNANETSTANANTNSGGGFTAYASSTQSNNGHGLDEKKKKQLKLIAVSIGVIVAIVLAIFIPWGGTERFVGSTANCELVLVLNYSDNTYTAKLTIFDTGEVIRGIGTFKIDNHLFGKFIEFYGEINISCELLVNIYDKQFIVVYGIYCYKQ